MSGGGVRVSIPSNVRKMIQNIKEITGNHSEEEIYAMLKDCSMDPMKLLRSFFFRHMNSRESGDARWKPGMQGRGSRGGRVNFSARHTSHDAGGGRNSGPARDGGTNQAAEKEDGTSLPAPQEKSRETSLSVSSAAVVANGATGEPSGSNSEIDASDLPSGSGISQNEVTSSPIAVICFSSSDPVLVPSNDSWLPGTVGTIKREVGSHRAVESDAVIPAEKSASETGIPFLQGKIPGKSQVGKGQLSESSQPSSASIHGGSSGSRPSSNYSSRSQQVIGPQKVRSKLLRAEFEFSSSKVCLLNSNNLKTYIARLEEEINYYKNALEEINNDIGFHKGFDYYLYVIG
ncbi:hypothetical protein GH714_023127 [Hevea brasiliensis]|uniref:GBF-interacting protein 1 N-terminal domain-containing protein n=1 Tax=Hevea brasiliensis TaxID=3981 RepID=A0A6A6KWX2_HEVBR|nr:hypothetical protein GH714_023127 [Hevea brasiliensis]